MSLKALSGPPPFLQDEALLTLVTDLSTALIPGADLIFDFNVEECQLCKGKQAIGILINNDRWSVHYENRCQVAGLGPGYHLLRAFILHETANNRLECVKSEYCFVAAEFSVGSPPDITKRDYLFGQPSICLLPLISSSEPQMKGVFLDFFVNNCTLRQKQNDVSPGWGVRLFLGQKVLDTVYDWQAYALTLDDGADASGRSNGEIKVRAVLVSPSGEERSFPSYNNTERVAAQTTEARRHSITQADANKLEFQGKANQSGTEHAALSEVRVSAEVKAEYDIGDRFRPL